MVTVLDLSFQLMLSLRALEGFKGKMKSFGSKAFGEEKGANDEPDS